MIMRRAVRPGNVSSSWSAEPSRCSAAPHALRERTTGVDMNLRLVPSIALLVLAAAGCGSTSQSSNNTTPEDQRIWTAAREQHGVGMLDDRTFEVRISPKGKERDISQPDTLEFAGGRMHSTACD